MIQINNAIEKLNNLLLNNYLECEKKINTYNLSDKIKFRSKSQIYVYLNEAINITFKMNQTDNIDSEMLNRLIVILNSLFRFNDESGGLFNFTSLLPEIEIIKQYLK